MTSDPGGKSSLPAPPPNATHPGCWCDFGCDRCGDGVCYVCEVRKGFWRLCERCYRIDYADGPGVRYAR